MDSKWALAIGVILGLSVTVGAVIYYYEIRPRTNRSSSSLSYKSMEPRVKQQNEATYYWTDWEGLQRSLTVHRKVETA